MTLKINSENQCQKSTLKINIKNNIGNRHSKSSLETTLKINIEKKSSKKTRYIHVAYRYHRPGCFAPNISVTFPPFMVSYGKCARFTPNRQPPKSTSVSLSKSLVRDATKNEPFVEDPSKENVRQKNAASNKTPQMWKRNGSKRDRGAKAYG